MILLYLKNYKVKVRCSKFDSKFNRTRPSPTSHRHKRSVSVSLYIQKFDLIITVNPTVSYLNLSGVEGERSVLQAESWYPQPARVPQPPPFHPSVSAQGESVHPLIDRAGLLNMQKPSANGF